MYCICSIPSYSNKKNKKVNTHCLSYPPWPLFQDIHTHLHTRTLFVPIVKIQSISILCGFHIYEFPYLLKLTIIPQNQYLGCFCSHSWACAERQKKKWVAPYAHFQMRSNTATLCLLVSAPLTNVLCIVYLLPCFFASCAFS